MYLHTHTTYHTYTHAISLHSQENCSPVKIDQALSKNGGFGAELLSEFRTIPKYTVTIKLTEDDNKKPVAKACVTVMVSLHLQQELFS